MPNPATSRIAAISSHLSSSPNPEVVAKKMATERKPPITCHVLDTTIGKPGKDIPVTLTLYAPLSRSYYLLQTQSILTLNAATPPNPPHPLHHLTHSHPSPTLTAA